jgi:hypothetical protein
MPDLKDMTDTELVELYNGLGDEELTELDQALLDEIERRNLDL